MFNNNFKSINQIYKLLNNKMDLQGKQVHANKFKSNDIFNQDNSTYVLTILINKSSLVIQIDQNMNINIKTIIFLLLIQTL